MGGDAIGPGIEALDRPAAGKAGPRIETDPVCGALVSPKPGPRSHRHGGRLFFFCSLRCLRAFAARPEAYLGGRLAGVWGTRPAGYACPMHPERLLQGSGTCPTCGLVLEPRASPEEAESYRALVDLRRRFWSSVALTAPLLAIALMDQLAGGPLARALSPQVLGWSELVLATPVVLVGGRRLFERALLGLLALRPDRFLLLALGAGAAWTASVLATVAPGLTPDWILSAGAQGGIYCREAALLVTLALAGELLEHRVVGRNRLARPSAIELRARRVSPQRAGGSARLARRAAMEIGSRRLGSLVVVSALAAAAATFAFWASREAGMPAFSSALAVLVIACPWALIVSAPASLAIASICAARAGMRVQRAEALEALGRADTLLLGEESLLVDASPRLIAVASTGRFEDGELLCLGAAAARALGHELADTLVEGAAERGLEPARLARRRGRIALVRGHEVSLAGLESLERLGLAPGRLGAIAEDCRRAGGIPAFVLVDGELGGILALSGRLSGAARRALAQLRGSGLRVVLLTREQAERERAKARRLGVDEVRAVPPRRRAPLIAELQRRGHRVALLARRDEPAAALEQADVALIDAAARTQARLGATILIEGKGLGPMLRARRLALSTVRNIRQSQLAAAAYLALATPAAAVAALFLGGWAPGPGGAGVAVLASLGLVILNARRLRRTAL